MLRIGSPARGRTRRIAFVAVLALAISAILFVPGVLAVTPEEVTRDHDADWHMRHSKCTGTSTGAQDFTAGPVGLPGELNDDTPGDSATGGPPAGTGSLRFTIGDNGNSLEENRNTRYSGRLVSDVVELTYWTYVQAVPIPPPSEIPAVYVGLSVDTDGNNVQDDVLVFEPGYQQTADDEGDSQPEVTAGTWQRWIAKDVGTAEDEGRWYRRSQPSAFNSLEGWAQQIPGLRIMDPATLTDVTDPERNGSLFLAAGCGPGTWDDFVGYADDLSLTINAPPASSLDYDFDPPSPSEASRLQCVPEEDLNPVGKAHTVTCTATNEQGQRVSGVQIDAEALGANDTNGDTPGSPDFSCTTVSDNPATTGTNEAGTCSFTHSAASTLRPGDTTYMAWIDVDGQNLTTEADRNEGPDENTDPGPRPEIDDTDVVLKEWVPLLDCSPETVELPPNTANTITCTVRDATSAGIPSMNVDIELSGPNDTESPTAISYGSPDLTCTTSSSGSCSVTHGPGGTGSTAAVGRTTYRAWIDLDGLNSTFEVDQGEGRNEATAPGDVGETDYTDVFEANWSTTAATPTPTPTVTGTPTPTPTPTVTSTGSPSPTPTPTPTVVPPHGCAGHPDAATGTPGDDVMIGTSGDDTICGMGGDDVIRGKDGDDLLLGGRGSDAIRGGRGSDLVKGGSGPDDLVGGAGRDSLRGGKGNDELDGRGGRDSCLGGPGRDQLRRCE